MKKLILLSLIISLGFSFNPLKEENISIHTHNHSHIQGNTHLHEHIHVDSSSKFFHEDQVFKSVESAFKTSYIDIEKPYLDSIKQSIFKPPIV